MKQEIEIKGARVHNLKNLSVNIAHGKITVITGVSGSGKSSLAFNTIYAEGQRRFIESMSSYARQFLGKLNKPEVDFIKGLSPSIAIQQKVITSNPRSTVGTTTEIYDYLKLLYARIGKTISPISGNTVKKHSVTDCMEYLHSLKKDTKIAIVCPLNITLNNSLDKIIQIIYKQGFTRIYYSNSFHLIEDHLERKIPADTLLVIDRIQTDFSDDGAISRATDSISIAFAEGNGSCGILDPETNKIKWFNNRFELDGQVFQEPSSHFFAFNNPVGACKTCEGYGQILGIDEELVFPNRKLSVFEGAIAPWRGETMGEYLNELILNAKKFDFPIHRPIDDLTEEQIQTLWKGNQYFTGLQRFFKFLESQTYKIQYRVLLSRYRGKTSCHECHGTRLRGDAAFVKINGMSIQECVLLPLDECFNFFNSLKLDKYETQLANRILPEIQSRLRFLLDVGLGYLTLNRAANSLSGGESQRINLATSLGSSLVGSIYVLDEPSIGLHPRDTARLISVLQELKLLGNTVIIVEHEEEVMKAADQIIDIGPKAGVFGGEVVFQGSFSQLKGKELGLSSELIGKFNGLSGDLKAISLVEFIDQNPLGKSSRSNPITYVKAFDDIRELYSRQALAKMRAYKPGFFSFNVEGGRCEMCEGEGTITVAMQFMADVHLTCETCKGKRYKSETLEIEYRGKSIYELLETNLADALAFFKAGTDRLDQKIVDKIQPLVDVGLSYLKVGQSSSTMSGGEAQRVKLASFLSKGNNAPSTLFIFD
ncbi:MAG: excinuclease ABC subunit UvrA, partial [Crocinitomicaceae bacterium]|nr:excinuclease ABC subunit UvrA [Crocinitomicaceae bacterium]